MLVGETAGSVVVATPPVVTGVLVILDEVVCRTTDAELEVDSTVDVEVGTSVVDVDEEEESVLLDALEAELAESESVTDTLLEMDAEAEADPETEADSETEAELDAALTLALTPAEPEAVADAPAELSPYAGAAPGVWPTIAPVPQ